MNKHIGRTMMSNAEQYGQIPPKQFDSHSGHTSVMQACNKKFTLYIARQKRITMALCSTDLKSCYDRIVHAMAFISMQQQNVPESACMCMFTTLQKLKHTIRTMYGDSASEYEGTLWVVPVIGLGQGNGAGPIIWAVVSTPVLNMLRIQGYRVFYMSCISEEEIHLVGYSFMDDTDIVQSDPEEQDPLATEVRMQGALVIWDRGMGATGGALEPAQSFWYLLSFAREHGCWRYVTIDETPANVSVLGATGGRVTLKRLEAHGSHNT
jgi:hypothetical protein